MADRFLVVDSARLRRRAFLGGVGLTVVGAFLACGGPSPSSQASSAAQSSSTPTIQMTVDNTFDPSSLTVTKGTTVTFLNSSAMEHTATDDPSKAINKSDSTLPAGAQPWDSGLVQPGQSWNHRFDAAGTYNYFCVPHETLGMVGQITVT